MTFSKRFFYSTFVALALLGCDGAKVSNENSGMSIQ